MWAYMARAKKQNQRGKGKKGQSKDLHQAVTQVLSKIVNTQNKKNKNGKKPNNLDRYKADKQNTHIGFSNVPKKQGSLNPVIMRWLTGDVKLHYVAKACKFEERQFIRDIHHNLKYSTVESNGEYNDAINQTLGLGAAIVDKILKAIPQSGFGYNRQRFINFCLDKGFDIIFSPQNAFPNFEKYDDRMMDLFGENSLKSKKDCVGKHIDHRIMLMANEYRERFYQLLEDLRFVRTHNVDLKLRKFFNRKSGDYGLLAGLPQAQQAIAVVNKSHKLSPLKAHERTADVLASVIKEGDKVENVKEQTEQSVNRFAVMELVSKLHNVVQECMHFWCELCQFDSSVLQKWYYSLIIRAINNGEWLKDDIDSINHVLLVFDNMAVKLKTTNILDKLNFSKLNNESSFEMGLKDLKDNSSRSMRYTARDFQTQIKLEYNMPKLYIPSFKKKVERDIYDQLVSIMSSNGVDMFRWEQDGLATNPNDDNKFFAMSWNFNAMDYLKSSANVCNEIDDGDTKILHSSLGNKFRLPCKASMYIMELPNFMKLSNAQVSGYCDFSDFLEQVTTNTDIVNPLVKFCFKYTIYSQDQLRSEKGFKWNKFKGEKGYEPYSALIKPRLFPVGRTQPEELHMIGVDKIESWNGDKYDFTTDVAMIEYGSSGGSGAGEGVNNRGGSGTTGKGSGSGDVNITDASAKRGGNLISLKNLDTETIKREAEEMINTEFSDLLSNKLYALLIVNFALKSIGDDAARTVYDNWIDNAVQNNLTQELDFATFIENTFHKFSTNLRPDNAVIAIRQVMQAYVNAIRASPPPEDNTQRAASLVRGTVSERDLSAAGTSTPDPVDKKQRPLSASAAGR